MRPPATTPGGTLATPAGNNPRRHLRMLAEAMGQEHPSLVDPAAVEMRIRR